MGLDLPWETLALVLLVFLGAGVLKGALGFGLPLMTMSVLPFLIPVEVALAINSIVLPSANAVQFVGAGLAVPTLVRFWPVIAGIVVGVPIGAAFLQALDEHAVLLLLGSLVIAFSALTVWVPKLRVPPRLERGAGAGTGVVAGIVGALTTSNGPVLVMYLVGLGVERRLFVSALGLLFIVSGLLFATSFAVIGILDLERSLLALACLVPAMLGMWAGNRSGRRMSSERFRTVILCALSVLGMNLVWRGLSG